MTRGATPQVGGPLNHLGGGGGGGPPDQTPKPQKAAAPSEFAGIS